MFTGIIEEIGEIIAITEHKIKIKANTVLQDTKIGDSIAVNGVCLTVTEIGNDSFCAEVSNETLKVTNIGMLKIGSEVNLERALMANGRFGGHIVSGHIDGTGKFYGIKKDGDFYILEIELDQNDAKYLIQKGSITINGISLTIANIEKNKIKIAIIPHTYENTNIKSLKSGEYVNIEIDLISKYVEKFLSMRDNRTGIDMEFLIKNGF